MCAPEVVQMISTKSHMISNVLKIEPTTMGTSQTLLEDHNQRKLQILAEVQPNIPIVAIVFLGFIIRKHGGFHQQPFGFHRTPGS